MEIRKPTVIVFAGAMLFLVGAVAFLLGRETMRGPDAAAPVPTPVAVVPSAPVAPAPNVAVVPPAPAPLVPNVAPAPAERVPTPAPAAAAVPPPPPSQPPGDAAAVRQYFAQVAAIQASGPSGDATEFANRVLAAAMEGDSSGFDNLLQTAEAGADRARALVVPPPCVEYQRQMLALMKDSVDMLRSLRAAIRTGNSEALAGIAGSASALQSRADALQTEERRIRASVGLSE